MTIAAFLGWEERQERRWEFRGFAPIAITGGTAAHPAIQRNLVIALGRRLRGGRCQVYTSDLKVRVSCSIRYPDAFVVCSPGPPRATVVADPVVVFEVLSPSTASKDLFVKNREYWDTPSIRRYAMLTQDRIAATIFERQSDDWVGHVLGGNAVLAMPEIGVDVKLAELYEGRALGEAEIGDALANPQFW